MSGLPGLFAALDAADPPPAETGGSPVAPAVALDAHVGFAARALDAEIGAARRAEARPATTPAFPPPGAAHGHPMGGAGPVARPPPPGGGRKSGPVGPPRRYGASTRTAAKP